MLATIILLAVSACAVGSSPPAKLAPRNNTELGDYHSNANPDVSGRVTIPGFRLDTPYPGAGGSSTPWSLELNITRWTESTMSVEPANATRISAQIIPPAPGSPGEVLASNGSFAASEEIRQTWRVSIIGFGGTNAGGYVFDHLKTVPEGNDEQNGTCPDSVFSEQCREELGRNIATSRGVIAGNDIPRNVDIPESCEGYRNIHVARVNLTGEFTRSTVRNYESRREMDVPGEGYDILGTKTWPFIIIWGHGNQTTGSLRDDQVTFACVKADRHHGPAAMPTGGDDIEEDATGAAARVAISGCLGTWATACFIMLVTHMLL